MWLPIFAHFSISRLLLLTGGSILDLWLEEYNTHRTHQGKYCNGRTPMDCFSKDKHLAQEKMIGFDLSDTAVDKATETTQEREENKSFSQEMN